MTSPAYVLQVAQGAALLADATIITLVGVNVFDDVSAPDSVYPRICIGDDQIIAETNTCSDPSEVYSTVHIWVANSDTAADARLKAKQIGAEVRRVLSQTMTLTGHSMTSALCHGEQYLVDNDETTPDGRVCHAVLTFHYQTNPTA